MSDDQSIIDDKKKFTIKDDIDIAEEEFEGYSYSICLVDSEGSVQGLFVDISLAQQIADLLNA